MIGAAGPAVIAEIDRQSRPPVQMVLFSGIGDHVLWLGLLPHVRRNHRVIVTCAPAMEELAWLYRDPITRCGSSLDAEISDSSNAAR